jgi:hypothetical protein
MTTNLSTPMRADKGRRLQGTPVPATQPFATQSLGGTCTLMISLACTSFELLAPSCSSAGLFRVLQEDSSLGGVSYQSTATGTCTSIQCNVTGGGGASIRLTALKTGWPVQMQQHICSPCNPRMP